MEQWRSKDIRNGVVSIDKECQLSSSSQKQPIFYLTVFLLRRLVEDRFY